VLKVYPYAKMASERLKKLNSRLDKITSKRKRKKYTRMLEKFLQDELTAELKRLTRTEGQILVKLIYRETGSTAFSLVRELRNGFKAFTYNTIAKVFKISLKEKYDPFNVREDQFIEDILRNIDL
jgi:ABC-type phosphate transport system auxiliary subunit